VLVAFVLCITGYSDISYDGTAFASVLASGIRGRQDRLGRILGAASVGVRS
jgi:ABC-2 type transport system permease protein